MKPEIRHNTDWGDGKRLILSLICYAVLAAVAWFHLSGQIRLGVWLLLAVLALKGCIAMRREATRTAPSTGGDIPPSEKMDSV